MNFIEQLHSILGEIYPNRDYSITCDSSEEIASVETPDQGWFFFHRDHDTPDYIREQLRAGLTRSRLLERFEDEGPEGVALEEHFSSYEPLSKDDKEALEFAKRLQREMQIYRNVGAFVILILSIILPLILPSVLNHVSLIAADQAVQATLEWHQEVEARISKLEQAAEYEKSLKALQNKNETLENRLKQLESVHSIK